MSLRRYKKDIYAIPCEGEEKAIHFKLIDTICVNGENSYTQFKADVSNSDKLAQQLVAFSNARSGLLIIGVDDDGGIIGVDTKDVQRINQLIGNVINKKSPRKSLECFHEQLYAALCHHD